MNFGVLAIEGEGIYSNWVALASIYSTCMCIYNAYECNCST